MKFTELPPDELLQSGAGFSAQELRGLLPATDRRSRRSTDSARLTSYIRQLCVLGVESHTVMPPLFEAIKQLVGADSGTFWWADESYGLADIYLEPADAQVAAALPRYVTTPEEFAQRTREAHGADFATAMRTGRGWGNTTTHEACLLKSLEFELMWRPLNLRHGLELTVTQNGRGWGSLIFVRANGARPFDSRAEAVLASLSSFVAHAVLNPVRARRFAALPTESGVVVSDPAGRILWQSAQGIRLMRQAEANATAFETRPQNLPGWLRLLVERVKLSGANEVCAPPVTHRRTPWGEFGVRAYPLLGADPTLRSASCYAIHIERREPLVLQTVRGAHTLGLSKRQVELCSHLTGNASYAEIARRVGVRPASVIDHVRKMYTRFDVHDRHGLLRTLGAAALSSTVR